MHDQHHDLRDLKGMAEAPTFFCWGSSMLATSLAISLRIDLAATPVVAVLKSKWLPPRERAVGSGLSDMVVSLGDSINGVSLTKRSSEYQTHGGGWVWNGGVVVVEMRRIWGEDGDRWICSRFCR